MLHAVMARFCCYCHSYVPILLLFITIMQFLRSRSQSCEPLFQPRIVGGEEVSSSSDILPLMTAIRIPNFDGSQGLCSGTLVAPQWVLTAAHCFQRSPDGPSSVVVGSTSAFSGGQRVPVRRVITHPEYDRSLFRNDIALIELRQPARVEGGVGFVRVNGDKGLDSGPARAVGYGVTRRNAGDSGRLREVDVPIIDIERCKELLESTRFSSSLLNQQAEVLASVLGKSWQMCAARSEGGCDSCQGDSGGPLFMQDSNRRWFVAGVVSFGLDCGLRGAPGIYARASSYQRWIFDTTREAATVTGSGGAGTTSNPADDDLGSGGISRTVIIAIAAGGALVVVAFLGFLALAARRVLRRRRERADHHGQGDVELSPGRYFSSAQGAGAGDYPPYGYPAPPPPPPPVSPPSVSPGSTQYATSTSVHSPHTGIRYNAPPPVATSGEGGFRI